MSHNSDGGLHDANLSRITSAASQAAQVGTTFLVTSDGRQLSATFGRGVSASPVTGAILKAPMLWRLMPPYWSRTVYSLPPASDMGLTRTRLAVASVSASAGRDKELFKQHPAMTLIRRGGAQLTW